MTGNQCETIEKLNCNAIHMKKAFTHCNTFQMEAHCHPFNMTT